MRCRPSSTSCRWGLPAERPRSRKPLVRAGAGGAGYLTTGVHCHEAYLLLVSPRQWQMAGPAHRIVYGRGGSDGPDQRGSPDEVAWRVAVPDRVVPVQRRIGRHRGASGAGGGRQAMNDPFEKKVRAAAVAGWWVILIG